MTFNTLKTKYLKLFKYIDEYKNDIYNKNNTQDILKRLKKQIIKMVVGLFIALPSHNAVMFLNAALDTYITTIKNQLSKVLAD